jgi:peptidoglycan/xylan/chitin deacetylase (PgdA/CDA1 family)
MQILAATVWDDGLVSDLTLLPILERHGAQASFALCAAAYGAAPQPNDARSTAYGLRIASSSLRRYAPYDVCNHTDAHVELTRVSPAKATIAIRSGKRLLEDIFEREVAAFCYPYGCYDADVQQLVKSAGHRFARASASPGCRTTRFHWDDLFALVPTSRWDHPDPESLIEAAGRERGSLLFWGHTYEITSARHWDQVERLYQLLTTAREVSLVSFTTLGDFLASTKKE